MKEGPILIASFSFFGDMIRFLIFGALIKFLFFGALNTNLVFNDTFLTERWLCFTSSFLAPKTNNKYHILSITAF